MVRMINIYIPVINEWAHQSTAFPPYIVPWILDDFERSVMKQNRSSSYSNMDREEDLGPLQGGFLCRRPSCLQRCFVRHPWLILRGCACVSTFHGMEDLEIFSCESILFCTFWAQIELVCVCELGSSQPSYYQRPSPSSHGGVCWRMQLNHRELLLFDVRLVIHPFERWVVSANADSYY